MPQKPRKHAQQVFSCIEQLLVAVQASPDGSAILWARGPATAVVTDVHMLQDTCTISLQSSEGAGAPGIKGMRLRLKSMHWSCDGSLIALLHQDERAGGERQAVVSIHAAATGLQLHAERSVPSPSKIH